MSRANGTRQVASANLAGPTSFLRAAAAGESESGLKKTPRKSDHRCVSETRIRIRPIIACALCAVVLFAACRRGPPKYVPDSVHLGTDGVVYLHSKAKAAIFRLSLAEWRYLPQLNLGPDSLQVAYSAVDHVLYVSYADGGLTRVDLGSGLTEEPFAELPDAPPTGLVVTGSHLLAATRAMWGVLAADGTVVDEQAWHTYVSESIVWSDANARAYQTEGDPEPSNILWRAIDPATGLLGSSGESPYSTEFPVRHPIRISRDGAELLTGAGLVYDGVTLEIRDALPVDPEDAIWLDDGLITLSETPERATQLDQWNGDRSHFNRQLYPGRPVRILEHGSEYVVVTQAGDSPAFQIYVPSDDPDGDGIANTEDAFPLDPAASQDADLDGWPDAWNPGMDAGDSTAGLELDAFPGDSACWLPEQGSGGVCGVGGSIPDFDPDEVVVGSDDVVYLLAADLGRIFRWSLREGRFLNPIVIHGHPDLMGYSRLLHRLYLAYPDRSLTVIDLASTLDERAFATTFQPATGLGVADPYVVVSEESGDESHHSFAPDGTRVTWMDRYWTMTSFHWAWSPVHARLYHFRDHIWPNDLHFESVDPATGALGAHGESPYHSQFVIAPPIRLSPDESLVLIGSGDLYDAVTLQVVASLPIDPVDAAWPAADSLLTLRSGSDGNTVLEHWDGALRWSNTAHFAGQPRRVLSWSGGIAVMTLEQGRLRFSAYLATDDADGDAVANQEDAFPLDPAASLDSDGDGHPDAWNPGMDADDSTTGLEIDAFPADSACWLPEQGTGGVCDVAAAIPGYLPDRIAMGQGDIVYLLSLSENRVFRWSAATGGPLNPIVIGPGARDMAYAAENDRLYIAYEDGRITRIDATAPASEHPFAVLHSAARTLTAFGPFLFGQDDLQWSYVLDSNGVRVQRGTVCRNRKPWEWCEANSRLYTTCDGTGCSPDDVIWIPADPVAGSVGCGGDSPYHGGIDVKNPIRVEANGDRLLDGSGKVWDALSLEILDSLPWPITDAHWDESRLLALHDSGDGTSRVEQRDPLSLADWGSSAFDGAPLRILPWSEGFVVVTQLGFQPAFHFFVPSDDADGDAVANPADAFPIDPAASSDVDGDGAPEEWNPGYGPGDSTQGLILDAFPSDFACQLPEHGVGGVCDFAWIVPPDAGQPLCASDDVAGVPATGFLAAPAAVDLVPLCDGWIAYGDRENERLVVQDVLSGRLGLVAPLSGTPADLELDAAAKRIHVAVRDGRAVAQVDLVTGEVIAFPFPDPVRAVQRDVGSGLVVSTLPWSSEETREHYLLDVETGAMEGPIEHSHFEMEWHPVRREFISGFRSSSSVVRNAVNFRTGLTFIESARWGDWGRALALSPDLEHVAFAANKSDGNSIAHFASGDLQTLLGVWRGANYPWDVEFDLASERLAASSNDSLQVFDVESHELLHVLTVPSCSSRQLREVGFSRGGALAFVKQECGTGGSSAQFHWLRIE